MPYIDLMVHPAVTPQQADVLATGITDAMVEVMGKRRDLTAVRVAPAAATLWSIGGEACGAPTAYLEVKITAGSNSETDKAQLLQRLHALLDSTLGGLAKASYIVVHELAADSWGYSGQTQAARRGQAQ